MIRQRKINDEEADIHGTQYYVEERIHYSDGSYNTKSKTDWIRIASNLTKREALQLLAMGVIVGEGS